MNAIFNSFRLIGYKINELPNGYFITQREDRKRSLFDNKGNILISNVQQIEYLSDYFYAAHILNNKENTSILYNKYGDIIDKAKYSHIYSINNTISVRCNDICNDSRQGIGFNIYEKDGNAEFKNVKTSWYRVVKNDNKYKLVYTKRSGESLHVTDGITEPTKLQTTDMKLRNINNYYLDYELEDFSSSLIIDYNGNVIRKGNGYRIDSSITQSRNILSFSERTLSLGTSTGKLLKVVENNERILSANFTAQPNVIYIENYDGEVQLINLQTNKKSDKYEYIDCDTLIGKKGDMVCLINGKTLEPVSEIVNVEYWTKNNDVIIVTRNLNKYDEDSEEYYTLGLRKLVHEFE